MKKKNIALGFYQNSHTALEVLNKLRREGFYHTLSIHRSNTGKITKNLFNPTSSEIYTTLGLFFTVLLAVYISHFHMKSVVAATGVIFLTWLGYQVYYWLDNIKTFHHFKKSVIAEETLVIAKVNEKDVIQVLSIMRNVGSNHPLSFLLRPMHTNHSQVTPETLIEPLSMEALQDHAIKLAATLKNVSFKKTFNNPLQQRLEKNAKSIADIRHDVTEAEHIEQIVDLSAEWFLDNMYVIQSCIEEIKLGITFKYYQELPKVVSGSMKTLPRIYVVAKSLIDSTANRINRENITSYLNSYLSTDDLTSGELWALPLMLKLCLIEYIQLLATKIQTHLHEGELASYWGNRLLNVAKREPKRLNSFVDDLKNQIPHPSPHFAEELLDHIYDEPMVLPLVNDWIENKLQDKPNQIIKDVEQQKTIDEVAFSSAVISLITLSQLTWREIFEDLSPVNAILKNDPARIYPSMDFATRDNYRHALENISRGSNHSERDIAEAVLKMAQNGTDEITKHVGYYLVDAGKDKLEAQVHCPLSNPKKIRRWVHEHSTLVYLGSIALFTALIEWGLAHYSLNHGETLTRTVIYMLIALFPASEIVIQFLNFIIPRFFPPFKFPKMNFENGIPEAFKSIVVVPSMLLSEAETDRLTKQLEIHYLANPDTALKFGLLFDYADAQAEILDEDQPLLDHALAVFKALEDKYGPDKFFLFLRKRVWSKSEHSWIGWERKRGKLETLNRFLSGETIQDNFLRFGNRDSLNNIRFVITLDSDNQLPKDKARQLIEILAHPLNAPVLNADNIVKRGYVIIQPGVCTDYTQSKETLFTKLFSDSVGVDPYTQAVSDVYQDLMLEGTYHGKGIYDLYSFNKILSGKFLDERILSHDLIEGAFTRVGYASEVLLFDQFPKDYLTWIKRQHRWFRGDWQVLDWMFSTIKEGGKKILNPLSAINRWKIFDNLRRALMLPAIFTLLLITWLTSSSAFIWTVLTLITLFIPTFAIVLNQNFRSLNALVDSGKQFLNSLTKIGINISLLPHQVINSIDALVRVLYRRIFSHRKLLEWSYSHQLSSIIENKLLIRSLIVISILSLGIIGLVSYLNPSALPYAVPFSLLWILSPIVATIIDSKKLFKRIQAEALSEEHRKYLRKIARRTWRYFDDFVNDQSNWLPPDNYQSDLNIEVAQRTSPTNIGLWLLTVITANDLHYLSYDSTLEKLNASFQTLGRLELYETHLLNWYDTQTLKPLLPRYVSTVDNGNFLASLWTLEQAIYQLIDNPILPIHVVNGLQDTYELLIEDQGPNLPKNDLKQLSEHLAEKPKTLVETIHHLKRTIEQVENLLKTEGLNKAENYWLQKLLNQAKDYISCQQRYLYWIEIIEDGLHQDLDVLTHQTLKSYLDVSKVPSIKALASGEAFEGLNQCIEKIQQKSDLSPAIKEWINRLNEAIHKAQWFSGEQFHATQELLKSVERFSNIDMAFLYNPQRRLFTIGYNVEDCKMDSSHYDLLASEARISSLVSIAKGDVPLEHWWALGRPYRRIDGLDALISWSGTMFEYLMPMLFMRYYEDSLLGNGCKNALICQIDYAKKRGTPWGISEAAFSEIDARRTYQYRSFGVPGLGFKRGLDEDLVISPYSTGLALSIDPAKAIKNLHELSHHPQNLYSDYGFYESIDYAREKGPQGERGLIVYAYMAHHQGMMLLAIDNCLNNCALVDRFHKNPYVKGAEALLYERIPISPPITKEYRKQIPVTRISPISNMPMLGVMKSTESTSPKVNLLSNGAYSIMVTSTGGGYSRWQDNDIMRWRADTTCDQWGSFCYIKDTATGKFWSTTYQPTLTKGQNFNASFKVDKVEFTRKDEDIVTTTSITVSPTDDVEVRLITLANVSKVERTLELTSYQELALAPHNTDRAHTCFNKFFIQTEGQQSLSGLLAFRRLRSKEDPPIWCGHVVASNHLGFQPLQFETDRSQFIGRGNSLYNPAAMWNDLKNTEGYVLDPIFSLRRTITIAPGQRVEIAFVTVIANNRDAVISLIDKYKEIAACKLTFEMAWTRAQLELRHLRIDQEDAQLYQKLASRILYPHSQLRISSDRLRKNTLGQSSLWKYGISGDLPIVAVTITEGQEIDLVKQLLAAHTFWRFRGLKVDCVILNQESYSYEQPLFAQLNRLIHSFAGSHGVEIGKSGGIYLLNSEQMPEDDVTLILSVARAHLVASRGYLRQHLVSTMQTSTYPPKLQIKIKPKEYLSKPLPFMELPFYNGIGGYTLDGKEYVIYLGANQNTPAPWINVISNPQFGMLVSEAGLGCTWYGNSQTNRLTNWSNDPVLNPITDTIYLRDEQSGTFWTPTPNPVRELDPYRIRHGQGYTCFEHNSHGIEQELTIFVPVDDHGGRPVRIQRIRLKNSTGHRRTISLFAYTEIVLGGEREETQMHLITDWNDEAHALFACNNYSTDYKGQVVFAFSSEPIVSYTGNRTEFIGRNKNGANPDALQRVYLSGVSGAGYDPCLAIHVQVELDINEEKEIAIMLGYAPDLVSAKNLIASYNNLEGVNTAFINTKKWWDEYLGTIQVECPDPIINFALNRWLPYQNLSCRIWGRSAFYQSSGAYGFRDQLQDVMAVLYHTPNIAREQILKSASRQFVEGDVQHWWLPPLNGGVRTRISDDLLWLPFVTAQYVRVTNDRSILSEIVPFIKGDLLKDDQHETFFIPEVSEESATLLEHCRRAIKKGNTKGKNGLPLIGGGDWNDGMNLVGIEGKGESVWLAWFLIHVIKDFAELLAINGDLDERENILKEVDILAKNIEDSSWDGNWYRRAYFDDGTPLGSESNIEDKIDSLPQSWAIISGAGNKDRAKIALDSVEKHLVWKNEKMILLLTPAFDVMPHDPGYIKGYPPGIRENGGQYTHGSLWVPLAYARSGNGDKAVELLKMMHPTNHALTAEDVNKYKIEPYVLAGDVYSAKGKEGRGGWSWYTGASGWMYRIWIEEILGLEIRGDILKLDPRLPKDWPTAKLEYRFKRSVYKIEITNSGIENKYVLELDGQPLPTNEVSLVDDGKTHVIRA